MPRPKSKSDLLQLSAANYERLMNMIDAMPRSQQHAEFRPGTMNRNVRDVLAHLHHWHTLMLGWYDVGMAGNKPTMPAEGYTWKTLPALNRWIWEHYRKTPLSRTRQMLAGSFDEVQALIHRHSDAELFTKKHYAWTGSTSLGAYLISATSSHYDWAIKLIKRATVSPD